MHIEAITMRRGTGDNYAYLVTDDATKHAVIIDPAEPEEVLPTLKKRQAEGIEIKAIVNTHHHYDHAGGNEDLLAGELSGVNVIGGKDCAQVKTTPEHNSMFPLGDNIEVTALHTPCHTQDSICYYFVDKTKNQRAVFTGDTLFTAGCGRFFEGTADEMIKALDTLGKLPDDTKVYSGHEYTRGNVKFAKTILENEALTKLDQFASSHEQTTGVFTIGDEKKFNPFMLTSDKQVHKKVGFENPIEVMAKLRELKNNM